jgi:hypothetical protein
VLYLFTVCPRVLHLQSNARLLSGILLLTAAATGQERLPLGGAPLTPPTQWASVIPVVRALTAIGRTCTAGATV